MIQVRNLKKTFGPKVAVSGISFEVKKGEVLAMFATACNPATNGDCVANVLGTQAATKLGSK